MSFKDSIKKILKVQGKKVCSISDEMGCTPANISTTFKMNNPKLSTLKTITKTLDYDVWLKPKKGKKGKQYKL